MIASATLRACRAALWGCLGGSALLLSRGEVELATVGAFGAVAYLTLCTSEAEDDDR